MTPPRLEPNLPDAKIRLVVVDDHPLVRESMTVLLGGEPGLDVVASCETADACTSVVRDLDPDVVLMDIEMPGSSAFKVAAELRKEGCKARFIFLSAYLTDSNVQEILAIGGSGYLLKSAGVKEIADAVTAVAGGASHFAPEVMLRVRETQPGARAARPRSRLELLTSREKEVLRCVASDLSGKEIANLLGLSVRTVDRHKANIMEKLAIHSQVGLTRFALAEGLCDPRSPHTALASQPRQ